MTRRVKLARQALLVTLAAIFMAGGAMHFVTPHFYEQIMPPFLPWHRPLVYLSGVVEAGLGALLLVPRTRRLAAWGLVVTLIAIFPANIYMATSGVIIEGLPAFMSQPTATSRWLRLPFQAVFVAWAWMFTTESEVPRAHQELGNP